MAARLRYRTQFCFIAPGALLNRFASVSHTHLVLPQVRNERYKEFYLRKRSEGDLIILDNGAYEMGDSIDFEKMAEAIEFYNPQVAALPDFLLQEGEKTFEASKEFMKLVAPNFPGVKWMYIPQSVPYAENPHSFSLWKSWMNQGIKHLKPDWIGVPRALATDIAHPLARVDAVEELSIRGIKTHALGLVKGDLKELEYLFWEGCCSCDSGAPIWRGVHESLLGLETHTGRWDATGPVVDFDWNQPVSPNIEKTIKYNMNLVLTTVNQPRIA